MINEILDNVTGRFRDAFAGISDYVYQAEWWAVVALVIVACLVIGFFLPFKWVRAGLAIIVALITAAAVGAQAAGNHYKEDRKRKQAEIDALKSTPRGEKPGGWFPFS